MQSSFFQTKPFNIIERLIVHPHTHDCTMPGPSVVHTFDFLGWKLSSASETKSPWDSEAQARAQRWMQNYANPAGVCVTTIREINFFKTLAAFLYIPGEFCRQSDLLEAAKCSGLPVVVEKGLFLSPNDIGRLAEKLHGSDFSLVECGSSNGYSDVILDPRSLHLMQKHAPSFGINISTLHAAEGIHYAHRPAWLTHPQFIPSFINTGKAFGASFFVIKNYGENPLKANTILENM